MKLFLSLSVLIAATGVAPAVSILAPGDAIIGGARVGGNFEVGTVGFTGGANNWPGAEVPEDLIDGVIGGGGEKYLNFAELDTGVIITPAAGTSIVTGMELWVANDAAERDPASYELWGTNADISGGGASILPQTSPRFLQGPWRSLIFGTTWLMPWERVRL